MSKLNPFKLLVEAILPIVLVVGTKYISVFVINYLLSYSWEFSFSASQVFSLPFIQYSSSNDLLIANSISSLVMIMVLGIGFSFVFFRFQHFHEKFISPKIAANLHVSKIESIIFSEVDAHNQLTVWFTLSWIVFLTALLEFLAGSIVLVVLIIELTVVLFLSLVTLSDMHKKASFKKGKSRLS